MKLICRIASLLASLAWFGQVTAADRPDFGLIDIPAGKAQLGDPGGDANEVVETRDVPAFRVMRLEVTNAQFGEFVATTEHRTDPQKNGEGYVWWNTWRLVKGADWKHPHGPESTIAGKSSHPVMQVSARDADAFCRHYGMRLPSDAEWEYAARGSDGRRYPWGNVVFGAAGMRQAKPPQPQMRILLVTCSYFYTSGGSAFLRQRQSQACAKQEAACQLIAQLPVAIQPVACG